MQKKRDQHRLTASEMSVLRMLWDVGEVTLSEAHRALTERGEQVAYTTVQTRLERLVEKGVLGKSPQRPTKYRAEIAPEEVGGALLDLLLERVSGAVPLFAHLIQDPSLSREDFKEMKRLIAEAERRQAKGDRS